MDLFESWACRNPRSEGVMHLLVMLCQPCVSLCDACGSLFHTRYEVARFHVVGLVGKKCVNTDVDGFIHGSCDRQNHEMATLFVV